MYDLRVGSQPTRSFASVALACSLCDLGLQFEVGGGPSPRDGDVFLTRLLA